MDKSEGTDFISKTFSSLSEKISKLYHTGNMKLSLSSLKRSRSEKVRALGNKVVDLIAADKAITASTLKSEYNAIVELDKQIELAEKDLQKIKTPVAAKTAEKKEKPARKARVAKAEKAEKAPKALKAPKPAKAAKTPKKTSAKKSNLPAVRPRKTAKVTQVTTPTPEVIAVENKDAE